MTDPGGKKNTIFEKKKKKTVRRGKRFFKNYGIMGISNSSLYTNTVAEW